MKANNKKSVRRRSISDKRFNKIRSFMRSCFQTVKSFEDEVARLVDIIAIKSITIAPEKKGDDPVTVDLTKAEVDGYKLKLKQAKLKLKKARKALKKAEDAFKDACRHNAECEMENSKKFNSGLAAEYKAKREKVERKEMVVNIVINLKTTVDPRFVSLLNAVEDGGTFRKELDAILKQEDEVTYTTISGLSAVKTDIYKSVRAELFPKDEDDNSADTGNDDDEDTAAAVVPEG